jgi:hypothetical protein
MIYYIKKYTIPGTDIEYITPEDIFDYGKEENEKLQYLYMFLNDIAKELNYYNHNSTTAFGNPDLEFYRGQIRGFLKAKQWEWIEQEKENGILITIKSRTGKTLFKIEKPKIPNAELERRREISEDLDRFGF